MEHIKAYSKNSNPNATFYVDDRLVVDLFPYKIKDRNLFYHRNHPENIHPESLAYEEYWLNFIKKCIEGKWIQDKDGTWVFMMPKLFYYINYVIILNKSRKRVPPDLCDLEWIFFTYFLCIDGFSGFSGDDKYTCNSLVKRYNLSVDPKLSKDERELNELNEIEIESIPKNCYSKQTGKFKEYVDPWTYLTRTYLIDDPRGPLGEPLYDNPCSNGFILGARGIRKSFTVYMGDFMHEWTFSNIRKFEDLGEAKNSRLFAMGSGSSDQMQRTINNIRGFYDNQPGRYKYDDPEIPDWLGPLYKNYQGKFEVGKEFQHIIKGKRDVIELFGSTCQVSAIRPDRTKIVAGDRFRRVYIEEVGFIDYIEEVFSANIDSLRVEDESVGSWIATGTGGDMESIRGSKNMYEHPEAFDIFGIPYYWKNPDKKIGLFIPAQYQKRQYDDGNGFIYLDLATKDVLKDRKKWAETLDSVNSSSRVMYNPIEPDEMLIPNTMSILPKREAQYRLSDLESRDVNKYMANIGTLVYDAAYSHGVRFDKDFDNKIHPIEDYNVDFSKIDRSGGFIMYEPPPSGKVPKYMYWVIYDPAAKSGEGTSLHSVIVYKHFMTTDGKTFRDTIVAEWIGRYLTLDENYEQVIKIAKYYNAKIFPEINVAGFVEWCKTNNYYSLLQRDNARLQKEISPNSKRSFYGVGFQMGPRSKWWALQRYASWLMEVKKYDPETGIPIFRNIDAIHSKRVLNEIVFYNDTDNFDHTSSMLGLMILIDQLENYKPPQEEDLDDDEWTEPPQYQAPVLIRRRSLLEKF